VRVIEHYPDGPHKLLRIETQGCAVHISAGLHDADGREFTAIEVEPYLPADDESVWHAEGPLTILVKNGGAQIMPGDGTKSRARKGKAS
jgi:hypothetical protein